MSIDHEDLKPGTGSRINADRMALQYRAFALAWRACAPDWPRMMYHTSIASSRKVA